MLVLFRIMRLSIGSITLLLIVVGLRFGVPVRASQDEIPRPTIINTGEVKETRAGGGKLDRINVGKTKAVRAANGMLVIRTSPDDAEIKIDGKASGRAVEGKFEKELPSGKKYNVEVSAAGDYEAFKNSVTLKRGEVKVLDAALTSKYGAIKIFPVIDGVKILLDGQPVPPNKLVIDKDNKELAAIIGVTPGEHEVTYDHPEYVRYKNTFKVSPGSELSWSFRPELARAEVSVVSDPNVKVYIDGAPAGETPADGVLKKPDVRLGTHQIKLVKEDYQEYSESRVLEYGKPVRIEKRLDPLPTSGEFNDYFDVPAPAKWVMPKTGCEFKSGRLFLENAPVLMFPKDIKYFDFQMHFHLKLTDGGGAAWAIRVRDQNNYYLFYLSGPKGRFPGYFNTYIVRDGKLDVDNPAGSVPIVVDVKAGGEYEIALKSNGNKFETMIQPAATGENLTLGFFEDKDNLFRYGGIGFRTIGSEKFSVDDLFVGPH